MSAVCRHYISAKCPPYSLHARPTVDGCVCHAVIEAFNVNVDLLSHLTFNRTRPTSAPDHPLLLTKNQRSNKWVHRSITLSFRLSFFCSSIHRGFILSLA